MKRTLLCISLVASFPVFPQNSPMAPPSDVTVFRTRDGFRVSADGGRTVSVVAARIEDPKLSHVVRFKGNVEITVAGVEVQADEVDYHWDTGEIEPYGNVHLMPVAPKETSIKDRNNQIPKVSISGAELFDPRTLELQSPFTETRISKLTQY